MECTKCGAALDVAKSECVYCGASVPQHLRKVEKTGDFIDSVGSVITGNYGYKSDSSSIKPQISHFEEKKSEGMSTVVKIGIGFIVIIFILILINH
jgi:uncharacterized membrane protein YvbJ